MKEFTMSELKPNASVMNQMIVELGDIAKLTHGTDGKLDECLCNVPVPKGW